MHEEPTGLESRVTDVKTNGPAEDSSSSPAWAGQAGSGRLWTKQRKNRPVSIRQVGVISSPVRLQSSFRKPGMI